MSGRAAVRTTVLGGQAFAVPIGPETLSVSAEQDVRGCVAIYVRRYGADGSEAPELLSLRPVHATELANALDRALHVAGVRR
jgi:hypothetical protein